MDFFKYFSETSPFKTTAPTKKSEKKKPSSNQNQNQSQNQNQKLDSNSSTGNENATTSISTTSTTTTTSSATTSTTIGPVKKKKTRTTFTGKKNLKFFNKNLLDVFTCFGITANLIQIFKVNISSTGGHLTEFHLIESLDRKFLIKQAFDRN